MHKMAHCVPLPWPYTIMNNVKKPTRPCDASLPLIKNRICARIMTVTQHAVISMMGVHQRHRIAVE